MPLDGNNQETGWISKNAFQVGALAADSVGREAMAAQYVQTTHIQDGAVTAAKMATAVIGHIGVYDLDQYDLALYG